MKFQVPDIKLLKFQALQWASGFEVCCYLDGNGYADKYSKFDVLIAAGAKNEIRVTGPGAFSQLEAFKKKHSGWLTGFLTYDLKNEIEQLNSDLPDGLHFPQLHFFEPQHLLILRGNEAELLSENAGEIWPEIQNQVIKDDHCSPRLNLQSRFSDNEYIAAVNRIKEHIVRGDVYVTNFCQEFFAENAVIDPLTFFIKLNRLSPNPFAVFYKLGDQYIICASPERFLAKRDNKLISQPIKGTAGRAESPAQDQQIIARLQNDRKELQENVMIVDLVRNDLTHSAKPGTVATEELFGIYSFRHVHQMISTVVCELDGRVSAVQAIKNTFPMGSMTGAPKISAMQLMERYERSKRGVYSGAIGYFSPDGDFDFNVVIRSVLYNAGKKYLSFQAGSAITYDADAHREYDECMLKASAILDVLGQNNLS